MSYLTGMAIEAEVNLTIREDAASQTRTKGNGNEVAHTVSRSECLLTQSDDMRVVSHSNGQSQLVTHHSSQGDYPFPGHIRCVDDTACQEIGAVSAYSDRTNGVITAIKLHKTNDFLA